MNRKDLGPVLSAGQLSEVRALLRQLERSGSLLELAKPSVVSLLRAIDVENDGTTVLVESPRIDETGDIAIPDEVVDLRLLLECRRERDEARAAKEQIAKNWMDWQARAVKAESENERLRLALRRIELCHGEFPTARDAAGRMVSIARAALRGEALAECEALKHAMAQARDVFDCEPAAKDVLDYVQELAKAKSRNEWESE